MAEERAVGAVLFGEEIGAASVVDHRYVQVHGAAGLGLHRLRHKGGVHAMGQGHLAHDALEHRHLVAKRHRVAMHEVDLELGRA